MTLHLGRNGFFLVTNGFLKGLQIQIYRIEIGFQVDLSLFGRNVHNFDILFFQRRIS